MPTVLWKKGQSGNPNGRPKGEGIQKKLLDALEKSRKEHNKSFLEHFVEQAYKDNTVAIALAKKLLPDRIEGDGLKIGAYVIVRSTAENTQAQPEAGRLHIQQ